MPNIQPERVRFRAHRDASINFIFMVAILAALIAAPPGWREGIMISVALAAYLLTQARIHRTNELSFAPLKLPSPS